MLLFFRKIGLECGDGGVQPIVRNIAVQNHSDRWGLPTDTNARIRHVDAQRVGILVTWGKEQHVAAQLSIPCAHFGQRCG